MELIRQHRWLAAGVAAFVVVGALWAGVPAGTLLLVGVVLACPLMMLTMHGGGHGSGHDGHGDGADVQRRRPDGAGAADDPHAAHRHPADRAPW